MKKTMMADKRPRGRPPLPGKCLRMVILTDDLVAKAKRIGGGKNLSLGARRAIEQAKEKQ